MRDILQIPEFLYRFESFDARYTEETIVDIFVKNQIYLNSRTQFNDPFDSLPSIIGKIKKGDVIKHLSPNKNMNRKEKRKNLSGKDPDKIWDKLFFDKFINQIGIKSLSSQWNHIPLWSHYANNHSGYCIQFKPLESELKNVLRVKYTTERPKLEKLNFLINEDLFAEEVSEALVTKSHVWSSEAEFRIIKHGCAKAYEKISYNEINAVYFGVETKSTKIEMIRDQLKSSKIKFFQCKKHDLDFKIELIEI